MRRRSKTIIDWQRGGEESDLLYTESTGSLIHFFQRVKMATGGARLKVNKETVNDGQSEEFSPTPFILNPVTRDRKTSLLSLLLKDCIAKRRKETNLRLFCLTKKIHLGSLLAPLFRYTCTYPSNNSESTVECILRVR